MDVINIHQNQSNAKLGATASDQQQVSAQARARSTKVKHLEWVKDDQRREQLNGARGSADDHDSNEEDTDDA